MFSSNLFAYLAYQLTAAIGFTSTMIPSTRTGFGTAIMKGDPLYETLAGKQAKVGRVAINGYFL